MTDPYNVENRLNQLERLYKPPFSTSFSPQNQQTQPTPVIMVDWVTGFDGVRSYPVRFGSTVLLIDPNANKMYLKSLDQIGTVRISAYAYNEIKLPTQGENSSDEVGVLNDRISKLESILVEMTKQEGVKNAVESSNAKPDVTDKR